MVFEFVFELFVCVCVCACACVCSSILLLCSSILLFVHTYMSIPFTWNIVGDLKRGKSLTRQSGSLVASIWRDHKLVYVMSTNSSPQGDTTVQRKEKDGSNLSLPCPPNLVSYNKFMGGVDRSDQLRNYYRVRCKTRKFYHYIFWFVFDSAVVNAFIMCKNFAPITNTSIHQLTIKIFRLSLAEGLIGSYRSRQRYALPSSIKHCKNDPE